MKKETNRPYRLGLDVGTNSLGWFMVWLNEAGEPIGLGPGGVRIFPDGMTNDKKASNAAERRLARGQRRNRDRYLERRRTLMSTMIDGGLMPKDEAARKALVDLDPYDLRARAITEKLPLHHIGRALFHLNQRRGFKSNRKSDGANDEKGAIKEASSRLREAMAAANAQTLGVFLNGMHREREGVRVRNTSSGNKATYDFYPTRDLLVDEFEAIWRQQSKHHSQLTDTVRERVCDTIFFQRPLKSPPIGKCTLDPAQNPGDADGFRLAKAHPLSQRFRIWQEVRNLTVGETGSTPRDLTKEEADTIALALLQSNAVTFDKIRKLLRLPEGARFNLESERRKELLGDQTAKRLGAKKLYGKTWRGFPLERQIEIVERLLSEQNEEALIEWLVFETGVDRDLAEQIADAPLPDGYGRLGHRAVAAILPYMQAGMRYHDAALAAGYDHAKAPTGEILDRLPYYGEWLQDQVIGTGDHRDKKEDRWGRFPNPTVHIGLGQVRRVVNALIKKYGPPEQIVVELARNLKNSKKQKDEIEKQQKSNQRKNDRRRDQIKAAGHNVNHDTLLRMRLWEELNEDDVLDRRCPFTGEVISIKRLFSPEVEVEHLIPFQTSWDDSAANKTLCLRDANRAKGKKTAHDAFGHSPMINGRAYDWVEISARAANLPGNKKWRFEPDADKRFEEQGGFLARQLMETSWLARLTRHYLSCVTNPNEVWVIPGRLTAMIRGKWGLNSLLPDHNFKNAKNRADHRHHAIDAVVAGLTDRGLLQGMSRAYDDARDKIEVPLPWETFRDDLDAVLKRMIVSHKPEHGREGKLHEASAYGLNRHQQEGEGNLVYRKALTDLNGSEIARIRDDEIRTTLQAYIDENKTEGQKLVEVLAAFGNRTDLPFAPHGIRHVRLTKKEKLEYLVPIRDKEGAAYKAYSSGENLFVELYETSDGKWHGEPVTVFQANQKGFKPRWHSQFPEAKFIMQIYKGDLLRLEREGESQIFKVYQLEASANRFKLALHNEAGSLGTRHNDPDDPFRWLIASYNPLHTMGAQKVRVDALGIPWKHQP